MKKINKIVAEVLIMVIVITFIPIISFAAGNSMATATKINFDTKYTGAISENNQKDFYKLSLDKSGRIHIDLTAYIPETNFYLYDSNGKSIWKSKWKRWNDISKEFNMNENIDLTSGTFYFAVEKCDGNGNYNFKITFISANESFKEPNEGDNNSIATADTIHLGTKYIGQIAQNDDCDIYKTVLSSSGRMKLNLTAYIPMSDYFIYDEKGKELWSRKWMSWNDVSKELNINENIDLTEGTYYFAIKKYDGTGTYTFNFTFTSSNESFEEINGGSNNSIVDSNSISLGTKYYGQIAINDDCDIYKFNVTSTEKISVNIKAFIEYSEYYIYDSKGQEIWSLQWARWNETSQELNITQEVEIQNSGTYYFAVKKRDSYTGNYIFTIKSGAYIPQNGLLKDYDTGKWLYYEDGDVNYDFSGLVKNTYGWWYVDNGTIDFSYNGMAKNDYGWWYVKNGKLDQSYNGLAKNDYGWWFLKNGTIDFKYNGLAKNKYGWWYIQDGTINYRFKGLAKNKYGWWYIQNGTIDYKFKGLVKNQYGWWYVQNGTIDFKYNGYASNQYGIWKVVNGKVVGK